jgi:hypothetical protein
MIGLGVGSEVWRELEPPREQDELVLVIFFNAPEIFQPTPFMVEARRTNKNNLKHVMLVKPNGNAYPKLLLQFVWSILQQIKERERFLALELEKIQ